MATDKQYVHNLIEHLNPSQLEAVVHLLEVIADPVERSMADAPVETEPISKEEAAALDEAHESIARGEGIPHEEILREFGVKHER